MPPFLFVHCLRNNTRINLFYYLLYGTMSLLDEQPDLEINNNQPMINQGSYMQSKAQEQSNQYLSVEDQIETIRDVEFAVSTLKMIQDSIPEDEMQHSVVEVDANGLRNCLELFLSMSELYEGVNVACIEAFQQVKDCLVMYPVDHLKVVQLQH